MISANKSTSSVDELFSNAFALDVRAPYLPPSVVSGCARIAAWRIQERVFLSFGCLRGELSRRLSLHPETMDPGKCAVIGAMKPILKVMIWSSPSPAPFATKDPIRTPLVRQRSVFLRPPFTNPLFRQTTSICWPAACGQGEKSADRGIFPKGMVFTFRVGEGGRKPTFLRRK